jgi:hypothetical protein
MARQSNLAAGCLQGPQRSKSNVHPMDKVIARIERTYCVSRLHGPVLAGWHWHLACRRLLTACSTHPLQRTGSLAAQGAVLQRCSHTDPCEP